jgi:hypothetical protein
LLFRGERWPRDKCFFWTDFYASITTASRWMISDIDFHQYRTRYSRMLVPARSLVLTIGVGASLLIGAGTSGAQQAAAPAAVVLAPAVNDVAPNFTLPGATRYGLLKTPVTLADYRGRTVVLAFFFKARTKG